MTNIWIKIYSDGTLAEAIQLGEGEPAPVEGHWFKVAEIWWPGSPPLHSEVLKSIDERLKVVEEAQKATDESIGLLLKIMSDRNQKPPEHEWEEFELTMHGEPYTLWTCKRCGMRASIHPSDINTPCV